MSANFAETMIGEVADHSISAPPNVGTKRSALASMSSVAFGRRIQLVDATH